MDWMEEKRTVTLTIRQAARLRLCVELEINKCRKELEKAQKAHDKGDERYWEGQLRETEQALEALQ